MDIRGGNRVSQISFVLDSTCNKNFDGEFVIVNAVTMCCEDCQYLHWSHYIVSKIKNVAARLVFGLSSFDNVTSSLHEAIVAAVSRATNACSMQTDRSDRSRSRSLRRSYCVHTKLLNKVQAVLPHSCNPSLSQPDIPDANRPVRLCQ